MATPPTKRRRLEIPNSVKKAICELKRNNPRISLLDIKQRIHAERSLDIGKSTIGDILKDKDRWLNLPVDSGNQTRARKPQQDQLEDALYLWTTDMTARHAAINDEMMVEKAKVLGDQLNVTDFAYSRGWLQRFKDRRGIKRKLYEGEADSADMTAVETGRTELQHLLKDYDPDNIYNMDETGLFYRLGPNHTLATQAVRGTKKLKDRLTIALCANSTGTHKLKPFVIAKVQRPRCFGKTYDPNTYVFYRHNTKAWMTSDLFTDWIRDFDRQMQRQQRHVILLIDNAASHKTDEDQLRNVRIKHLKPNTTAHIQPMDAGVIHTFKAYYRKQLVRLYIECAENNEPQTVNIRQALHMVKSAWESVTPTTITNCFRHTGIMNQPPPTNSADDDEDEDEIPLSRLRRAAIDTCDDDDDTPLSVLMRQLQKDAAYPPLSADAYLQVDETLETGQTLGDDDILLLVSREGTTPDDCDDDDDDDATNSADSPDVTATQAQEHLQKVISFFEQTTPDTTDDTRLQNQQFLDQLWTMSAALKKTAVNRSRQTTISDFFRK